MNQNLLIMLPIFGMLLLISLSSAASLDSKKTDNDSTAADATSTTPPPKSNNNQGDSRKEGREYFAGSSPYGLPYPYPYPSENAYNPFPFYVPARLGGETGPGNTATSCAYAYPNRRYSCYGLGRR